MDSRPSAMLPLMSVLCITLIRPLGMMILLALLAGCTPSYFPDPAYDEANRVMDYNYQLSNRIMEAYVNLQSERLKSGEISQEKAKALIRLKGAELLADLSKADREIADGYERSISRGKSLTCTSTTSYNSTFTTCT